MLIPVKFVRGFSPYQAGEVAGFGENKVKWLVANKYATVWPNPRPSVETAPIKTAAPSPTRMVRKRK